jgi:hypothetical protein
MPALVAGIHVFGKHKGKAWMAGARAKSERVESIGIPLGREF